MAATDPKNIADILSLIRLRAVESSDAIALESVDGASISYGALEERIERNAAQLSAMSPGKRPRIGIVLANGLDMAVTLLGVSCAGVAIPFNPGYREKEFESYFQETHIDCLIVRADDKGAAAAVAARLGIPLLRVSDGARFQELSDPSQKAPLPHPDDVALVLLTSGSTGRSKAVPLTHRNVSTSAGDVCRSMGLGPADRCLSMWEQYHVGGLVDLLLAPLYSGGAVICTAGFNAAEFFRLLETKKPTWFQGVPTTLNELLVYARRNQLSPQPSSLKLLRSVAAPLSPQALEELQALFGKPVLQTYGMTEAGPLITSTGLAPGARKPGSVGRSCGPEVKVVGDNGQPAANGVSGQLAVRGPNVFSGYENDPESNAERFRDGWFFTGDIGYLDADGDLFITGRINQLINRGGEKVNPQEVDDALLHHAAVSAAASFSVKHRTLGEDISVAVVLKPGARATEQELRAFLSAHLAPFKIPGRIYFLEELPRNTIGKVDRRLAAEVTAAMDETKSGYVAPRSPLEIYLSQLWAIELDVPQIGIEDDFRNSGGDSLSQLRILLAVEQAFDIRISDAAAEALTTVGAMAAFLLKQAPGATAPEKQNYINGKLAGLDAHNTAKSMDALSTGPDAEEAAAEERLARSKTEKEFDAAIDALLIYKTPAQLLSLIDRGLPGDFPLLRWSTFRLRRKKKLLLKELKRELSGITDARLWQRQTLLPNAFLYQDPAVPAGNKTLLVGFGGNAQRLMMPTYCILKSLDPAGHDLLLLRDPARRHYEAGVLGLGDNIGTIAKALDAIARQSGYRQVMALGTSGGGLAALCVATVNGWARVVTVGCDSPTSHPEAVKYLSTIDGTKPELRLVYSEMVARDNDAAEALARLYPSAIRIADRETKTHNLLYHFYTQGALPRFFKDNFGAG